MINSIIGLFRTACRIIVAGVIGGVGYIVVRAWIECPDKLAVMAGTLVAGIGMIWYFFKAIAPKSVSSGMKKGSKKVWRRFWKFVF